MMLFPKLPTVAFSAVLVLSLVDLAVAGPQIPEPTAGLILPGGPPAGGTYTIGLSLELPEGWHTYWRYPGEAGLPPVISTAGSDNVAKATLHYPAPERYDDGYSTSIVYHDRVVFPLKVTPTDPDEPVRLELLLDYGFCREICVPARAELAATLHPTAPAAPLAAAMLVAANARVPVAEALAGNKAPRLISVDRRPAGEGDKAGHLLLMVAPAIPGGPVDVFAEGPDGWYLSVPDLVEAGSDRSVYRLSLAGAPRGSDPTGTEIRFTIVSPTSSVEAVRRLD